MQKKRVAKWIILLLLLTLVLTTTGSAITAAPSAQQPEEMAPSAIGCGDSASCTMSGPAVEVYNSGTGAAILGRNTSSVSGYGVYGRSTRGAGVRAESRNGYGLDANSRSWAGVRARSTSAPGVFAQSGDDYGVKATSTSNAAIWARGGAIAPDIILAGNDDTFSDGVIASDPDYGSSDFHISGQDDVHVWLDTNNDESGSFRIHKSTGSVVASIGEGGDLNLDDDLYLGRAGSGGSIYSSSDASGSLFFYSNDNINAHLDENNDETGSCFRIYNGNNGILWSQCETVGMTTVGSAAVAVETASGTRATYALTSPEIWLEDFGRGTLAEGKATVGIDPLFAEAANLNVDYYVYLTPVSGEAVLLFVTAKTPTSFEVQGITLDGSPSSAGFDYRIVAKRLGYEGQRLEQVDLAPAEEEP